MALEQTARESMETVRRGLGSPALFAVVYAAMASAIYFSLGVVAEHALGLTPLAFLAAGVLFVLTGMTYLEGSSLHQERGGSATFARYAFNELVSFVAGWAILLDYLILIALAAFSISHYLVPIWSPLGRSGVEVAVAGAVIVYVAVMNVRGLTGQRFGRLGGLALIDLAVQVLVIVAGLAVVFNAGTVLDSIDLGSAPTWEGLVYALVIATIAFTGIESSSGLAGEVGVDRRGMRRLIVVGAAAVMLTYVGMALVAIAAVPVVGGETALGSRFQEAPILGVVMAYEPAWLADGLKYLVAIVASGVLLAAANAGMLGLSRLGYSLATNRQIPSAVGRLHPTRSTPFVIVAIAAVLAFALVLPVDVKFLIGIYAFGAMLAFTIAHVSICVLRYREPDRDRPFRIPLSIRVGKGELPLPAALGALLSAAAWVSVVILHDGARMAGLLWMAFGLTVYVVYRKSQGKPLLRRVTIPEAALRDEPPDAEYGSILVPVFGSPLDDDIVQTAGRLAAADDPDDDIEGGAVIEVLYVIVVPMSLPLDARVPDAQVEEADRALRRAKAVGEEYEGVEVATAMVRARRAGEAIVQEAKHRGVEAIVLAAEEPSRIRGGALLGGRAGAVDNFVGDVTKYVIAKAPCRIVLTAPPADALPASPVPAATSES